MKHLTAGNQTYTQINNLRSRISSTEIRARLRNIDIISSTDWPPVPGEDSDYLGLELEMSYGAIESAILEDPHQVISAVLRGESLPVLRVAQIEETFVGLGGKYETS